MHLSLPLEKVRKVILAVDVVHLPGAPAQILGVINYHGEIIPVYNLRNKLGLPHKDIDLNDIMIILETSKTTAAVWADSVDTLQSIDMDRIVKHTFSEVPGIEGLVKTDAGIIYINDPEKFLSASEEHSLEKAISGLKNE